MGLPSTVFAPLRLQPMMIQSGLLTRQAFEIEKLCHNDLFLLHSRDPWTECPCHSVEIAELGRPLTKLHVFKHRSILHEKRHL